MAQLDPGESSSLLDEETVAIDLVHQTFDKKNEEIDPIIFREYSFQPRAIIATSTVGAVYFIYLFSAKCFSCSLSEDGAGGSGSLILLTWIPWAVIAVLFLLFSAYLICPSSMDSVRGTIIPLAVGWW